jgi:hypothetical protein
LLPDSEIILNNTIYKNIQPSSGNFLLSLKQQDGGRPTVSLVFALIGVNKEPLKSRI